MSDYSGEIVAVEVGRYGLRTFRCIPAREAQMPHEVASYYQTQRMIWQVLGLSGSDKSDGPMELVSTYMHGSHWKNGVCESKCLVHRDVYRDRLIELAALTTGSEAVYGHEAPNENCHCGIYAAHTLQTLRDQYRTYVDDIVAVVAAEGQTIIGDKGFRTQRARVVAYWCSEYLAATAETQFADAQRFPEIGPMLEKYGLETGAPPWLSLSPPTMGSLLEKALSPRPRRHFSPLLMAMVVFWVTFIAVTLLAGCAPAHASSVDYFPNVCRDLRNGMPLGALETVLTMQGYSEYAAGEFTGAQINAHCPDMRDVVLGEIR